MAAPVIRRRPALALSRVDSAEAELKTERRDTKVVRHFTMLSVFRKVHNGSRARIDATMAEQENHAESRFAPREFDRGRAVC